MTILELIEAVDDLKAGESAHILMYKVSDVINSKDDLTKANIRMLTSLAFVLGEHNAHNLHRDWGSKQR